MAGHTENGGGRRGSRWRIVVWAATPLILLLHLLAMQVTDEVVWSAADFAFAGALLVGAGLTYELAARKAGNIAYRAAVGVAGAAALLLVWLSLGVGIIGRDGDPANLMYFGVLAVGIIGALIARFRPRGMARALFATALARLVSVFALTAGWATLERPLSFRSNVFSSLCSSDRRGCFAVLRRATRMGPGYNPTAARRRAWRSRSYRRQCSLPLPRCSPAG